jgi:hypothetical protein
MLIVRVWKAVGTFKALPSLHFSVPERRTHLLDEMTGSTLSLGLGAATPDVMKERGLRSS